MKRRASSKISGFTIVELLIVIVIIAILAAITVVAYNGVQNSAKTAQAQTNAQNVLKKAVAFAAETGYYPPTKEAFDTIDVSELPANINFAYGNPSPTNGTDSVKYERCNGSSGSASQPAGAKVSYYDFSKKIVQLISHGDANDCTGVDPT